MNGRVLAVGALLLFASCSARRDVNRSSALEGCTLGKAVRDDSGVRHLAVLVGVGERASGGPVLTGPAADVSAFRRVVTRTYGVPDANVCALIDSDATLDRVRAAMSWMAHEASRGPSTSLIVLSGVGSRSLDLDGDEVDGWDESVVLYDSRTAGQPDLIDDELNTMVHGLTVNDSIVTVIVDADTSGEVPPDPPGGRVRAASRFESPPPLRHERPDGSGAMLSSALDDTVLVQASRDGSPALEVQGRGVLSQALTRVLFDAPSTWAQVARRTARRVAARSAQVPRFRGDLDRPVFGTEALDRPLYWEVTRPGPPIELAGVPVPGWGEGAVGLVYDGASTSADLADPDRARGRLVVTSTDGVTAEADALDPLSGVRTGDIVVLAEPGRQTAWLQVAVPPQWVSGFDAAMAQHPVAPRVLRRSARGDADVELAMTERGALQVLGYDGVVRFVVGADDPDRATRVVDALVLFARQRALLDLVPLPGGDESLSVRLVPIDQQTPCAEGIWVQAAAGMHQDVPPCHRFQIEISLAADAPAPQLVSALVLSNDGAILALPEFSSGVQVSPGGTTRLPSGERFFQSRAPSGIVEHVLAFATPVQRPVRWDRLVQAAPPSSDMGLLEKQLSNLLLADDEPIPSERSPASFTVRHLSMSVRGDQARCEALDSPLACLAAPRLIDLDRPARDLAQEGTQALADTPRVGADASLTQVLQVHAEEGQALTVVDERGDVVGTISAASLRSVAQRVLLSPPPPASARASLDDVVPDVREPALLFQEADTPLSVIVDLFTGLRGYGHLAIDGGENDSQGRPVIIEAVQQGVKRTAIADYAKHTLYRVPLSEFVGADATAHRRFVEIVRSKLGQRYDHGDIILGIDRDPESQICSGLAFEAFPEPVKVDVLRAMKAHDPLLDIDEPPKTYPHPTISPNDLARFIGLLQPRRSEHRIWP